MSTIFRVGATPETFQIQKAKTVEGKFGTQLWLAAVNGQGEEGSLYLPWAFQDGNMSGVVQQLCKTGLIGPEDFQPEAGVFYDQLQGAALKMDRVFKDGKQYINVTKVGDSPLQAAARTELSLGEMQKLDDGEFFAKIAGQPPAAKPAPRPAAKPRESADARIARAFAHVMENYAPQLGEMEPAFARVVAAMTALFAIAYEKEG